VDSRGSALVIPLSIIIAGCSLFHENPPEVTKGIRAVYQGVQANEKYTEAMLLDASVKLKAMIEYIHNYSWQLEYQQLERDYPIEAFTDWMSDEARQKASEQNAINKQKISALLAERTQERDKKIKVDQAKIDEWMKKWEGPAKENAAAMKQLLESIYNYMSTKPLSIENINSIIKSAGEIWDAMKEEK
jgi:hypothetical protein